MLFIEGQERPYGLNERVRAGGFSSGAGVRNFVSAENIAQRREIRTQIPRDHGDLVKGDAFVGQAQDFLGGQPDFVAGAGAGPDGCDWSYIRKSA